MWKLIVGFVVFVAIALYFISRAGDKIDMGGEKHGAEAVSAPAASAASAAR